MRVLDLGGNSLLELPLEVGSLTNLQVCVMLHFLYSITGLRVKSVSNVNYIVTDSFVNAETMLTTCSMGETCQRLQINGNGLKDGTISWQGLSSLSQLMMLTVDNNL